MRRSEDHPEGCPQSPFLGDHEHPNVGAISEALEHFGMAWLHETSGTESRFVDRTGDDSRYRADKGQAARSLHSEG